MRNSIRLASLVLVAAMCFMAISATAKAEELPFAVDSSAAILVDAATGQVIFEKNSQEAYDVAGMAKILSALVVAQALEQGEITLEQQVQISQTASRTGGMSAFLTSGASYPVSDLYKTMMMISANDATIALAEAISGSEEAFVARMPKKAAELGASPVLVNATGHKAAGQKMSAQDAAKIACALVKYPSALERSAVYMDYLTHAEGRETELVNPNRLVRFYEGCDGIATGSNSESGYSGAFTALRGSDRYIAVVIGARNANQRSEIAKKLLDYAFANFRSVIVMEKGKGVAKDVPVSGGMKKTVHGVAGESFSMLLAKTAEENLEKEVVLFEEIEAPLEEGQQIGELIIKSGGAEIARIPVVASEAVAKASIGTGFRLIMLDWLRR